MPRPRIIKSHQYFDPRFPRIIYVVRDPRDVLLSGYYFQRKRRVIDDHYPFEKYAARFMAGDFNPYAAWGDNVASWLATRFNQPGFLLLRYEDMLSNTAQELANRSSSRKCQILRFVMSEVRQVSSLQSRVQKKRCSADLPS